VAVISVPSGKLALDLHVHSAYSKDSIATLPDLIEAVRRRGLSGLALTDHNSIEGALRLRETALFPVIVGEEIMTQEGEIIGLFLERAIPRRLSPKDTVAAIREQGGLVYLPHPMDCARRAVLCAAGIAEIIADVDIVEVMNARVVLGRDNQRARQLADAHKLPCGAGSDAHTAGEVGAAYVLIPECDLADPRAFLHAIRQGVVVGHLSSPLVHLASTWAKLAKRFGLAPECGPA
jgi:hypothetical protein